MEVIQFDYSSIFQMGWFNKVVVNVTLEVLKKYAPSNLFLFKAGLIYQFQPLQ